MIYPEELYEDIKEHGLCGYCSDREIVSEAISNGTPLPKGHGRLVDADEEITGLKEMKVMDEADKQSVRFAILEFKYAKTIIEADKESEDTK